MSSRTRDAHKHAKARRRRYRTAQERLARDRRQALLRLQATTLAGFGVPFDGSCGEGHGVLLCSVWVFAECGMPKRPCHIPLAAVRAAPPRRHALPGLPAFLWQRCAV